jgi:hypothetical protein
MFDPILGSYCESGSQGGHESRVATWLLSGGSNSEEDVLHS